MVDQSPIQSEEQLLERCKAIEGLTFLQLANRVQRCIPEYPLQRKGWAGQAIERALGATAGTSASPDFIELGIELKTLPMNHMGKPSESTFITSIPLLTIHQETWLASTCFLKLKRVLWIPVEGDNAIEYSQRRIGQALLWSPSNEQEAILSQDWSELTWMLSSGKVDEVNANIGHYLQVRPKAANSKSLCYALDAEGNRILTLPRGFYLRSRFTSTLLR